MQSADYLQTRAFVLGRILTQESHKTRDPLADIDRIYVPEGADHQWGQQADPSRVDHSSGKAIKGVKKGNESGPSDSDERLESQEGNPPTKPDTHKI